MKIYSSKHFQTFSGGNSQDFDFLYKEALEHNMFKKNYFSAAFQGRVFSTRKPQLKKYCQTSAAFVRIGQLLLDQCI